MAIRYKGDLETLLRDLECRGYRVQSARRVAGAPGRSADIFLENGVVVRWDEYTQAVWAEGPLARLERVEKYLHRLYEGNWFSRRWARSFTSVTPARRIPEPAGPAADVAVG